MSWKPAKLNGVCTVLGVNRVWAGQEPKNDYEREADRLLSEDTRRRGSGLSVRAPKPTHEVLSADLAPLGCRAAQWDEYPSDTEDDVQFDDTIHTRYLEGVMASHLTDRQRECLTLVVLQGQSFRVAGAELSLAPGTVKSHVDTAVQKLRTVLEGSGLAKTLFPAFLD